MNGFEQALTAKGRYEQLAVMREPYLRRARHNAKYTVPYLFPDEGANYSTDFKDPHQSIGSRAVNSLSGKILTTMVPPSRSFHRLVPSASSERALRVQEKTNPEVRTELELALSRVEQEMMLDLARLRARGAAYDSIRQLIVGGNAAIVYDDNETRQFELSQYTCFRSYSGRILDFITKEATPRAELPAAWHELNVEKMANELPTEPYEESIDVYTWYKRLPNGGWRYFQEAGGILIPGTEGTIGKSRREPFQVLRWTRIDGEHYGRSYCDDFIGDLRAAEGLSRAIIRAAATGAKIIYLVAPNAYTKAFDLERAEDGEFVVGYKDDISMLSHEAKAYDLNVARQVLAEVEKRIEFAFLVATAIQRDAERVTAEEFRRMSEELQVGLGGPYTVLAEDFQHSLAEILLDRVSHRDPNMLKLPQQVEPTLITGVDALGRSQELQELAASLGIAQQILGPEVVQLYFDELEVLKRILASNGTRTDNLLKAQEKVDQLLQQRQMMQLAEKAAGPVSGAIAQGVSNGQAE